MVYSVRKSNRTSQGILETTPQKVEPMRGGGFLWSRECPNPLQLPSTHLVSQVYKVLANSVCTPTAVLCHGFLTPTLPVAHSTTALMEYQTFRPFENARVHLSLPMIPLPIPLKTFPPTASRPGALHPVNLDLIDGLRKAWETKILSIQFELVYSKPR